MQNKFAKLLTKYRKERRLTQRQLLGLLWDTGKCDRKVSGGKTKLKYNEPDVSKWGSGTTKPPSDVVDVLENILFIPKGLLLEAAGYHDAAELKKSREGLTDSEVGVRLDRDSRTVRKHLERAEQEKENSTKATVLDGDRTHQLIEKWRIEVASCSPTQLLQRWLDEASQNALSRFLTDEDTKMLYLEARRPHLKTGDPKRLYLQVECDPIFGLLRQKFPTSTVWTAFEAWGEQAMPYFRAFYDMLYDPESAAHSALNEEQLNNGNLSVFIKLCKLERLAAVLLLCDLLARGLAELPSNAPCWAFLGGDLEKLRLRGSLELSSLTKNTPKGGWPTGIKDICAYSGDLFDPLEETRTFLNELVKLQSIQDSIAIALQELESKI